MAIADRAVSRFQNLKRQRVLGFEVPVASTRRSRLLGLAFLDLERAGEGLLIPSCRAVHTFGMRFDLDLIFIGEEGEVVELRRAVPARRLIRCPNSAAVLELPSPPGPP